MRWIEANGASLRYLKAGEWGDKTPIVLVHEAGGAIESWTKVVDRLATRHPVVAYDQRGFGMSERAPVLSLQTLVDDLIALLDGLGIERAHLAGNATGGGVAMFAAALHPDRVASVTGTSPVVGGLPPTAKQTQHARAALVEEKGMREIADPSLVKSYPEHMRGPDFEQFRLRYLSNDPESFAALNRAMHEFELGPIEHQLIAPALIVGCTVDVYKSLDDAKALANRLPNGHFAQIDSGHFAAAIAPGPLAALISDFAEKADA